MTEGKFFRIPPKLPKSVAKSMPRSFFGEDVWAKVKTLGGRVAQCEITLLD